jgi:hypothetical protein
MLVYKAMYKTIDEGVHGEILDFSGAISDHSIWENPANRRRTAVKRHREIPEYTA